MHQTRVSLLIKLRDQGDENAWDEFVQFYRPYIYKVIQNMGVLACDIEDLLQEILLIAWKKLPDFEYDVNTGKFRSWLNTITKRDVIHFLQKKQKRKELPYDEEIQMLGFQSDDIENMIETEWEAYISNLAWEKVHLKFSDNVIECFKLLASGKSGEEVANELNLSVNSVYVYKKRVLSALQKEIAFLDH